MTEVVIVEAVRTPIGRRNGLLNSIEPIRRFASSNVPLIGGAY